MAKDKLTIMPLFDRVLIEPKEVKQMLKTSSGIILPGSDKERPAEGKIVALGHGRTDKHGAKIPFKVKVGDKVIFQKYGADEYTVENKTYLLMREEQILAILK